MSPLCLHLEEDCSYCLIGWRKGLSDLWQLSGPVWRFSDTWLSFWKPCIWKAFGYNCHIRSDWKGIWWPVHLPHKVFRQTPKVNFVFIPYKSYLPKKNFLSQTLLMLYSRRCSICSELSEIPVSLSLEACLHLFWRHSPFPILNG